MSRPVYDAIIVGGGPAGLSAAVVLGRCRRRILVCDDGMPRNRTSLAMHGYLSRDGINPAEFLKIGREELKPYGVEMREGLVTKACRDGTGFKVTFEDGTQVTARKLLLATGVVDKVPKIEGIEALYGRSVHHCPYCDGWEVRDKPLAVYGRGKHGFSLALSLKTWSPDVVLCTDGPAHLRKRDVKQLEQFEIVLHTGRIARLEGTGGILERIVFESGEAIERRAIFFNTGQEQCCDIAAKLGCIFSSKGAVVIDKKGDTNVAGLYVAGDAAWDVQYVIVAAAEGAKSGQAINEALQKEDRERILNGMRDGVTIK